MVVKIVRPPRDTNTDYYTPEEAVFLREVAAWRHANRVGHVSLVEAFRILRAMGYALQPPTAGEADRESS